MHPWRTFPLRIIRYSWGIAIDITARWSSVTDGTSDLIQVSPHLWLDIRTTELPAEDVTYLLSGLQRVGDDALSHAPAKDVVIEIGKVVYRPTDYQPEGMSAAIIGWAAEEFGFDPPEIQITFDRRANRYEFHFANQRKT